MIIEHNFSISVLLMVGILRRGASVRIAAPCRRGSMKPGTRERANVVAPACFRQDGGLSKTDAGPPDQEIDQGRRP